MLLQQLIASQQETYAQLQAQIESLQEQQRQIQAYLQRLGSVESKMESAAALIAEAVSAINSVCPDELPNYQNTINSLFGDAPIAQLAATNEPAHQPTPQPEPTAPDTDSNSSANTNIFVVNDAGAIAVEAVAVDEADAIYPNSETEEDDSESATELDFSKLTWVQLKNLAKSIGNGIKHKSRQEIEDDLEHYGISQSEIDQAAKD